jgi:hypothetical protein
LASFDASGATEVEPLRVTVGFAIAEPGKASTDAIAAAAIKWGVRMKPPEITSCASMDGRTGRTPTRAQSARALSPRGDGRG